MSSDEEGIKVILLGESFVGKTSLIKVSIGEKFSSIEATTISSNFSVKTFDYKGKKYNFNLWDTIGEEKYRSLTKIFFTDAKIVILVYDITDKKSFGQLGYWYEQVTDSLNDQDFILAIVGNKKDLCGREQITQDQGKTFAEEKKAKFKLTSAKDDPMSFITLLEELFKEYIDNFGGKKKRKNSKLKGKKDKKSGGCC